MGRSTRRTGTNTIQLLIMGAGFLVLAYYLTVSFTSGDLLWFLGGFRDRPSRLVVYVGGQTTALVPGDPGFDALAGAVQSSLAEGFAGLSNTGFSEQSLQDAYTRELTLEVFFDKPVSMHTWFPTGRTTRMLLPITGRHSDRTLVLLGDHEGYRVGAPVLKTTEPILETLGHLGFR